MTTPPPQKTYRIVVGFDFSELAERALDEAFHWASLRLPAEIHVITVAAPVGTLFRLPGDAEAITPELARETVRLWVGGAVDEYQKRHGPIGVDRVAVYVMTGVPAGDAAKPIIDLSAWLDADLIVVGTHGRTGVSRFVLGSVAARVARDARTSVQIVRPSDLVHRKSAKALSAAPDVPALEHFDSHRTFHYVGKATSTRAS